LRKVRIAAAILAVSAPLVLIRCSSGPKKPDKITRDLISLPKETLFEKGTTLLAQHKYEAARKYLNFLFESYPNDPLGQQALLLVANSYYDRNSPSDYVEARYRYRDYLARYPSAPNRDEVLYRYAVCYDKEQAKSSVDQATTRDALTQYEKLVQEFPGSKYAELAKKRVAALTDVLADHDFGVGLFYFHKGDPAAACKRFLYVEQRFPTYQQKDRLYYYLGKSLKRLGRMGEAERYFGRLQAEYPNSKWAQRSRRENHISVDNAQKSS
jgi:outer membrane protein assembly factor BamD